LYAMAAERSYCIVRIKRPFDESLTMMLPDGR
jgi:hypothetical protein